MKKWIIVALAAVIALFIGRALIRDAPRNAATKELIAALPTFPEMPAENYRPDLAVQVANKFIGADPFDAIAALEVVARIKTPFPHNAEQKVCHLCRLIFVPRSPTNQLHTPAQQRYTVPDAIMAARGPDWSCLPFAIVDQVPLSMVDASGYIYAGKPLMEAAVDYLRCCQADGVLRTNQYPVPTAESAGNALYTLFTSPSWQSLKWSDAKQRQRTEDSLGRQIDNMRSNSWEALKWSYTKQRQRAENSVGSQIDNMLTNESAVP